MKLPRSLAVVTALVAYINAGAMNLDTNGEGKKQNSSIQTVLPVESNVDSASISLSIAELRDRVQDAFANNDTDQFKALTEQLISEEVSINDKFFSQIFFNAVEGRKSLIFEFLIRKGVDVNLQNEFGQRALTCAAIRGHTDTVSKLIELGANVNARDKNKNTALLHAVSKGYIDIVKLLIDKGANINTADKDGNTALHYAAAHRCSGVVKMLIDKRTNVNARNNDQNTALHIAADRGYIDIVKMLIDARANINARNNNGYLALHYAAQNKYRDVVAELIDKGTDINARDNKGNTALHIAAAQQYYDVVAELIGKGANVNARNNNGYPALHVAADRGHIGIVKMLIDARADINARDLYEHTALFYAKQNGHSGVVKMLENQKKTFSNKDSGAIKKSNNSTQTLLLTETSKKNAKQADRKAIFEEQLNSLIQCIETQKWKDATAIFARIKSFVTNNGHTLLMTLLENQAVEAARWIISKDVSVIDRSGSKALTIAREKGYTEISETIESRLKSLDRKKMRQQKIADEKRRQEAEKLRIQQENKIRREQLRKELNLKRQLEQQKIKDAKWQAEKELKKKEEEEARKRAKKKNEEYTRMVSDEVIYGKFIPAGRLATRKVLRKDDVKEIIKSLTPDVLKKLYTSIITPFMTDRSIAGNDVAKLIDLMLKGKQSEYKDLKVSDAVIKSILQKILLEDTDDPTKKLIRSVFFNHIYKHFHEPTAEEKKEFKFSDAGQHTYLAEKWAQRSYDDETRNYAFANGVIERIIERGEFVFRPTNNGFTILLKNPGKGAMNYILEGAGKVVALLGTAGQTLDKGRLMKFGRFSKESMNPSEMTFAGWTFHFAFTISPHEATYTYDELARGLFGTCYVMPSAKK